MNLQQSYRPLFHSLPQALVVIDRDYTIMDATDKFLSMTKLDRSSLGKLTYQDIIGKEDLVAFETVFKSGVSNGSTHPMLDDEGRVSCLIHEIAKSDLMDHKHPADILERITDGFFTLNSKLLVTSINKVTAAWALKEKKEIIGQHVDNIFSAIDTKKYISHYRKVIREKNAMQFEVPYRSHHIEVQAYPLTDGGVAVFWRDVTDIRKADKKLKDALAMRNEFISIASHELKTPLSALMLQVEMAKRNIQQCGAEAIPPEKVEKIINNAYRDVQRLSRLVDDMLDVSRIASGKLTMNLVFFNLDEFMEELIERMNPIFPDFKSRVKVSLNAPVIVQWDRFRMEQVVMNLLTNAFRYGGDKKIELTTSAGGNMASITVKDKGLGIAKKNVNRIFERFERATTRDNSGLGLGLYICDAIVKNHGGLIRLSSKLGKGSTFCVDIPFKQS